MVIAVLSWWYTAGWKQYMHTISDRIDRFVDYFSFGLLLKTLFSPYRQISAGRVQGSFAVQWHAFVDRLVSRMIGAMIRTVVLIVGVLALLVVVVISIVQIVLWPIVPLLPIVGVLLAIIVGGYNGSI